VINHEGVPVLLTTGTEFATWLNARPAAALALAREYPPDRMRIAQEGSEKLDREGLAAVRHGHPDGAASRAKRFYNARAFPRKFGPWREGLVKQTTHDISALGGTTRTFNQVVVGSIPTGLTIKSIS